MAVKKTTPKKFSDAQHRQLETLVVGRNVAQGKLDEFVAYLVDEFGIIGEAGWTLAPDLSSFIKAEKPDDDRVQ